MKHPNFTETEIDKLRSLLLSGNSDNINLVEEICSNEIGMFQELITEEFEELRLSIISSIPWHFVTKSFIEHLNRMQGFNALGWTLQKFPKNLCNLRHIVYFSLSNNRIKEIPKEIVNLVNLRSIDLSNNPVCTYPEELLSLPKLEMVQFTEFVLRRDSLDEEFRKEQLFKLHK